MSTVSSGRRGSQGSQGSFHVSVDPPSSPDSRVMAASPTPSSSSSVSMKKRRVAVSRRAKGRHSTEKESDAGGGVAAEGEEPVSRGWEINLVVGGAM